MSNIKLIDNVTLLQKEFKRCCEEYSHLEMFVAWVGNPSNGLPYHYLNTLKSVQAYIGIAFYQTNPDGIKYLLDNKHKVIIVNSIDTYHPKLYFFSSKNIQALLIGSSNFTYSGFGENVEANVLIEGKSNYVLIKNYLKLVRNSIKAHNSFVPTKNWLTDYSKRYKLRLVNFKKAKAKDEVVRDEELNMYPSWLNKASWNIYLKYIKEGLKRDDIDFVENLEKKINLFIEYSKHLKIPWKPILFDTIENRRRINGKAGYGWLGHVGASGKIQKLLATGTDADKKIIVNSINKIASLTLPMDFDALRKELDKLVKLGPTIKVWGRYMAITRPDLYCTISSDYVRESLSILLNKPKSYFESIDGYIDLLKLIHDSPWFKSPRPKNKSEEQIWLRRVAFLDVIFY